MEILLSEEKRAANHASFDAATDRLRKQANIIGLMKQAIMTLQTNFNAMHGFLQSYVGSVTEQHYMLYNTHAQAFLHSLFMYLAEKDSNGNAYFNPVSEGSTTTEFNLTVKYPNSDITSTITHIDNITIDMINWDMYIGSLYIDAHNATQIASEILNEETPSRFLTKDEFILGLAKEIEKLTIFKAQVYLCENKLLAAIKYIAELKNTGIY